MLTQYGGLQNYLQVKSSIPNTKTRQHRADQEASIYKPNLQSTLEAIVAESWRAGLAYSLWVEALFLSWGTCLESVLFHTVYLRFLQSDWPFISSSFKAVGLLENEEVL